MGANRFQYFAGDIGFRLSDKSQLRFVVMEVNLTESHLSDDFWAQIIDGEGVTGYMRGYELNYDRFVWRGLYYMINIGYIDMEFESVDLPLRYRNKTFSIGSGIGYRIDLPIFDNRFFINPSIPIRFLTSPFEERNLGSGTVQAFDIAPSVWVFMGFRF